MTQRTPSRQQGHSLVEVMVALAVALTGLLMVVHLQVNTLKGVAGVRGMMEGTNLAEHFLETLKSEAIAWNMDSTAMTSQPSRFPHLRTVGAPAVQGGGSGWIRGYTTGFSSTDSRVGPMGNDAGWDPGIAQEIPPDVNPNFCLHYRLTWLVPDYLMRADVRVMWMRDSSDLSLYDDCPVGMETDLANVSSVTLPGTLMRNVFTD
jgi:hypothetical protein